MRRVHRINAALLVTAVLTGLALTSAASRRTPSDNQGDLPTVEDATGEQIPVRDYTRIVSTSTIADQVLVEIIDPTEEELPLGPEPVEAYDPEEEPYEDEPAETYDPEEAPLSDESEQPALKGPVAPPAGEDKPAN